MTQSVAAIKTGLQLRSHLQSITFIDRYQIVLLNGESFDYVQMTGYVICLQK